MSPLKCQFCSYVTPRADRLKRHVNQVHLEMRDAPCPKCDYRGGDEHKLKRHLQTQHGVVANPLFHQKYKCPECDFSAPDHLELLNHALSNHEEKKAGCLKCKKCDYSTSDKDNLNKHMRRKHGDKFKCELCEYTTSDGYNYKMHLKHKHEKLIDDTKCDVKEDSQSEDVQQEQTCKKCDYSTSSEYNLKRHMRRQHGDKFKCQECDFSTSDKYNFKQHLSTKHEKFEDDIEFAEGKAVPKTENIMGNNKSEDVKQEHVCENCDYATSNDYNFKKHMRRKHGDELKCHKCNFSTSDKHHFKKHLSTKHEKLKEEMKVEVKEDIPALETDKVKEDVTFPNLIKIIPHEHKCEKCDHSTSDKHQLKKHQSRMHETVLECQKCEFKGDKHSLLTHKKRYHDRLKCEKCDYSTKDSFNFKRHMETVHAGALIDVRPPRTGVHFMSEVTHEIGKVDNLTNELKCFKCKYIGVDKQKLKEHEQRMHVDVVDCAECDFKGDKYRLTKHIHNCHREKQIFEIKCEKCSYEYVGPEKGGLRKHIARMHGKILNCPKCEFNGDKHNYLKHLKIHGNENSRKEKHIFELKCGECSYVYKGLEKRKLKSHMERMHDKISNCPKCEFKGDKQSYLQHLMTHKNDTDFNVNEFHKCEQCDFSASQICHLKLHITRMHSSSDDLEYKCEKCEHSTSSKSRLNKHVLRMHENSIECPECEFTGDKYSFLNHKKTSHNYVVQKCEKCNYEYKGSDKHRLPEHLARMHEKIIDCPECDFKGDKHSYLQHRKDSHQGGKCDECDYSTSENSKLGKHKANMHGIHYERIDTVSLDDTNKSDKPIYELKCEKCDYEYKGDDKRRLQLHKANMHEKITSCPDCELKGDKHSMMRHIKTFHFQKERKCDKCDYSSTDSYNYKMHFQRMHEKITNCPDCEFEGDKLSLMKHKSFHRERKCDKCDFSATDNTNYKRHWQRMHGSLKNCPKCSFQGDKHNLQQHWKKLHRRKRWTKVDDQDRVPCGECEFKAANKQLLLSHMKVHGLVITHKCDVCPYSASTVRRVMMHKKSIHDGIKDFKCDVCPYSASTERRVMMHKRSIHDGIKDFKCDECPYKSARKCNLLTHMKIVHRKIKEFECNQCPSQFSYKFGLKMHQRSVHEGIKDYECDQCDYSCSVKQTMLTHKKAVHDKIKDNFCDQCHYSCSTKQMLRIHKKARHDSVKDHQCDVCPYQTAYKTALAIHKKHVHNGKKAFSKTKKKFKCDMCSFETNFKHSLFNHKKGIHDKIKDFKCSQCPFESAYRTSLLLHERSAHKTTTVAKSSRVTRLSMKTLEVKVTDIHKMGADVEIKHYKCDHCSFESKFKTSLVLHEKSVHNTTIDSRYKKASQNHEETDRDKSEGDMKSQKKKFGCTMCTFETNYKYSLPAHMKGVHFKIKPFKCDKCPYAAVLKQNLALHKRSHENIREECDLCTFKCASKQYLRSHKKKKHANIRKKPLASKNFNCTYCPYAGSYEHVLKIHMARKHGSHLKADELGAYKRYLKKSVKLEKPNVERAMLKESQNSRSVRTATRQQTQDIKNLAIKVEEMSKPVKKEDSDVKEWLAKNYSEIAEWGVKRKKQPKAVKIDQIGHAKKDKKCEPPKMEVVDEDEEDKIKEEPNGGAKCQVCKFTAGDFRALSEHYLHEHISVKSE